MSAPSARSRVIVVAALCLIVSACGQKGPPLPPLHLVPAQVTNFSARRIGDEVRLRFVLPTANANGPGPLELDRVQIFAITVPPGVVPANRILLSKEHLVGEIAVRPPLAEGEEPKEGDTRPEPGASVVFDEQLTAAKLTPVEMKIAEPPAPAPAAASPGAAPVPAAKAVPVSTDPVRVYAVRGVTRSGRPGPPSARVPLPIVPLPPAPTALSTRVTETTVVLEWKPPADASPSLHFNVYRGDDGRQPINAAPLSAPSFEYADAQFGKEYCFRVRTVLASKTGGIEGEPSDEMCVTPQDTFSPAAPKRPDAVATPGQINLIWDANTEKDLAGYLVLRGDAPDGTLQALTPAPIRDASYRDTTVQPGVRYAYAIVAVDNATPANTSQQSPRVEETAR
jgi:hypothetical protein